MEFNAGLISNILRNTVSNFNNLSIKQIQEDISLIKQELSSNLYDNDAEHTEDQRHSIEKILIIIDRKDILNMSINEVKTYLQKLITLIDFTMYPEEF